MSQQIVQMGGAAPGLSGDRVTMYVQNPTALALAKGTVVRITRSSNSGVEVANAMRAAPAGFESILAAGGIYGVLLEASTADTTALVHVCLRGRVDTLLAKPSGGSAINGDGTPLILATGPNTGGSSEYQGHLCSASDAPASGDAQTGQTVAPNPHKIIGYYVDALANAIPDDSAALRTIDFDGIAGYGMALGPIDVTPTPPAGAPS